MTERPDFTAIKRFTACVYDTPPKVWMNWTFEGEPGQEPRITDGDCRILRYILRNCNFKYREECFGCYGSVKGLAKQVGKERNIVRKGLSRLVDSGAVEVMPAEGNRSFYRVKHFELSPDVNNDFKALLESHGIRWQGYLGGLK